MYVAESPVGRHVTNDEAFAIRITFVLPSINLSGGIRIVVGHAERLQARGWDVTIVSTPKPRPPLRRRIRDWIARRGGATHNEASHLDASPVRHHQVESFRPIVDADVPDADVVVATWWRTAEWVAGLSLSKGAKAYLIQGLETSSGPPAQVLATWRLPMQKIVVSNWLAEIARNEFNDDHVCVVPNAVDHDVFRARAPRQKQDVLTVGFAYAPSPIKGADVMAQAIEIVQQRVDRLRVIAFGRVPVRADVPVPAGTEYHCRPPQSQIPQLYAACDAWLFGSRKEGFGLPVLEAMACGTPVVATPAGAATELLAGGGGRLVAMDDPHAMADAVLDIAAMDAGAWRDMSDAARKTVAPYTWERATELFEAALTQAMDRRRRGDI